MKFWEDMDSLGITAKCEYVNSQFIVTVFKDEIIKKEKFDPSFEPRFGMDVVDMNQSLQIAEKLAEEIELELSKDKIQ